MVPGSHSDFSSLSLHYYSVNRPCHGFGAILTSRQQLSSLYVYLKSNNFRKTAVLGKKYELKTKATTNDFIDKFWERKCA